MYTQYFESYLRYEWFIKLEGEFIDIVSVNTLTDDSIIVTYKHKYKKENKW